MEGGLMDVTLFDQIEAEELEAAEAPLVDRLRAGAEELRHLPLGGRGHLADLMREAAAALAEEDEPGAKTVAEYVTRYHPDVKQACDCGAPWFGVRETIAGGDDLAHLELTCGQGHAFMPGYTERLSDLDAKRLGPFVRDSETSRQAALANYPRQGSQRHRILARLYQRLLDDRPGATRDELAEGLKLSPNSVRPRVVELRAGGWIIAAADSDVDTDETRRTALGQESEVLVLTPAAIERLQREAG
jgi:hypothetical protein